MAKNPNKKIDDLINAAYIKVASGIQINIMDIPKVFAVGRAALQSGQDLETALTAFLATIRKN